MISTIPEKKSNQVVAFSEPIKRIIWIASTMGALYAVKSCSYGDPLISIYEADIAKKLVVYFTSAVITAISLNEILNKF
jgi:hypothetical protein